MLASTRRLLTLLTTLLFCAAPGACTPESSELSPGAGGEGGAGGTLIPEVEVMPGLGFVATSFGFFYPESSESFDGFDLDGTVSTSGAPSAGECPHDDFTGLNEEPGIDYNFLRVINDEETREDGKYVFGGFREGQLVDGVINGATKNGSMTILLQVRGVDDLLNDDEVVVQIFGSEDSPSLGTDNSVLAGATLGVHPEERFRTGEVDGAIVDGVLIAGPMDLRFPIDIMIVQDELLIRDSWLRLTLEATRFEGTVAGYWDVENIRSILGVPTTENGNAANFTIEQFDAAMAEHADGDYDSGVCSSISAMFQLQGVSAFLVEGGESGEDSGGCGAERPEQQPVLVDQCVNAADQAALEDLATDELSGPARLGMIAAECPTSACGTEVGNVLTNTSEEARNALGDCIAECMSERTGLSLACTGCYGAIAACSTGCCLQECLPPNSGSEECANCSLQNCIDVNACTGLY